MLSAFVLLLACLGLGVGVARYARPPIGLAQALNWWVIQIALPALVLGIVPSLHFDTALWFLVVTQWGVFFGAWALIAWVGARAHWSRGTIGGLILVTGPTGSGKSTTLAAMVDQINKTEFGHILTIEDPIEFVHQSKKCLVNQREVHRDTHGFEASLRSALREDPDYILVGEMRDLETIRLALTAAETGHLVFGTLHTSSAAKTIDRIIDVFPAAEKGMVRSMLSESLRAVISQSLLKKVGGGRMAAHEIMVATPAIRNLIREDKVAQMYSSIQTGQASGMQTLDQCLLELVKKGQIAKNQAWDYAKDKKLFD